MKDTISRHSKHLEIPPVLEAIKERLVEARFNIDNYDIPTGSIDGRRNNMDKVILGLYRKVSIRAEKKKDHLNIEIKWGGLISSCSISALQFFIVPLAFLRSFGTQGVIISGLIGILGISLNLIIFFALRAKIISTIKRDLHDLEKARMKRKRKKNLMDGL